MVGGGEGCGIFSTPWIDNRYHLLNVNCDQHLRHECAYRLFYIILFLSFQDKLQKTMINNHVKHNDLHFERLKE